MPSLRFITSSSAPLTAEEWRRFETRFGIPLAQGYGSSETGWIAAIPASAPRFGTVGRPLAYHGLAIVGADGRRLPPGETGQVELGGLPGTPTATSPTTAAWRSTAAAASAPATSVCSTPTASCA